MDRQKEGRKRPSPKTNHPQRMGDVVSRLLVRSGVGQTQLMEEYQAAWIQLAGEALGEHCRVDGLRQGVLKVTVRNSVILQELVFRKQELLGGIAHRFPDHGIQDMRFRVGQID